MRTAFSALCTNCGSATGRPLGNTEAASYGLGFLVGNSQRTGCVVTAISGGMVSWMMSGRRGGLVGLAGVLLVAGSAGGTGQGGANGWQKDGQMQADVMKSSEKKRFQDD